MSDGSCGRLRNSVRSEKHRLDVAAAVGFKGDPVTPLDLGVEVDVAVFKGYAVHRLGQRRVGTPAGDGLILRQRIAHAGDGDHIARLAGAGFHNAAIMAVEEHVECAVIARLNDHLHIGGDGNRKREVNLVVARIPADELAARHFGRGGGADALTVFRNNGGDLSAVLILENDGQIGVIRLHGFDPHSLLRFLPFLCCGRLRGGCGRRGIPVLNRGRRSRFGGRGWDFFRKRSRRQNHQQHANCQQEAK